jgi:hypothetical protein
MDAASNYGKRYIMWFVKDKIERRALRKKEKIIIKFFIILFFVFQKFSFNSASIYKVLFWKGRTKRLERTLPMTLYIYIGNEINSNWV